MLLQRMTLGAVIVGLALAACSDTEATKTVVPNVGVRGGTIDTTKEVGPGLRGDDQTSIVWGPAPPIFPAGAQFAVVQGDPSRAGEVFTVRLRFPNGYALKPHFHPADEYVTVLQGDFLAGMGEDFSTAALVSVKADGFTTMPANMAHFAMMRGVTEVQVHGIGPFALTYVHPEDDPTK